MVCNISSLQMDSNFCEENYNYKVNVLKRKLTLDLPLNNLNNYKRSKCSPVVLSSPDLKMLNVSSTELEKLILAEQSNNNLLQTPTPNTIQLLFPKTLHDDQELYAQEIVNVFNDFNNDSSHGNVHIDTLNKNSNNYINMDIQYPTTLASNYGIVMSPDSNVVIKDEPQTVPSLGSTPPLSPINMESQEKIKLERKRQRNRVAASKCRKRKMEKISKLEDKVRSLKGENNELGQIVLLLKEEVSTLKQKVIKHVSNGCQINVSSNF